LSGKRFKQKRLLGKPLLFLELLAEFDGSCSLELLFVRLIESSAFIGNV